MGDIAIRPAEARDAAAIARIHVESWQSTYAGLLPDEILVNLDSAQHEARWWRHVLGRFRRNHFVYVAEAPSEGVVGFASAGPSRQTALPYRGEVYTIYLRDDYHGNGIGKQLFASTVAGVQEARGPSVIVWCLSANPSRFFYEHRGGSLVARRTGKVGVSPVEEVGYAWGDASELAVWGRA
ncbi:MAG: GNAT family N-acetyltransferase [Alphaproteobacteria bacterium]